MFSLKASISSTETDLIIIISKRNSWVKHHVHQLIYQQLFIENINYFSDDSNCNGIACCKKHCFALISVVSTQAHIKILYEEYAHQRFMRQPCFCSLDASSKNYMLSMVLADYAVYGPKMMLYCIIK